MRQCAADRPRFAHFSRERWQTSSKGVQNGKEMGRNAKRVAVGYVRVSTLEQAREGVSLDAQRARIAAHCASRDYQLIEIYADEGISGRKTRNRPGLEAALYEVCKNRGCLIVFSLSRLARSTPDAIRIAERIQKAGAELVMLAEQVDTSSAAGKMFYTVLAALAAFESDQVGERTSLALRYKKSKGERWCSSAPFGHSFRDGRLAENPDEQKTLRTIWKLRRQDLPVREIAKRINEQGHRNRSGRPFRFQAVAEFLARIST